jgi:hypothetical protein
MRILISIALLAIVLQSQASASVDLNIQDAHQPTLNETVASEQLHTEEPMTNRQLGELMASDYGWTDKQWLCLEKLWTNESNWNHTVANYQGSGAYGIPQALPAHKMASHGHDYLSNPETQIGWGLKYIKNRYKSPCEALSFWNARVPINGQDVGHWY